jgi:hypothetical protein
MLFSSISVRALLLIPLLGGFTFNIADSLHSQVKLNYLSMQQELRKELCYANTFYDKKKLVATVRYNLNNNRQYAYLDLLKVEKDYRSAGLGSVIFKRIMGNIALAIKKEQPGIILVKWWACPFDPPAGMQRTDMENRLYDFYRRQGATVDNSGHAELNLLEQGYL